MSARRPALLLTLTLASCSPNWQPLAVPQPKPLPVRTVVEFHAGDKTVTLHAVQFTTDSIVGIPWLEHTSCDTCRVSYALKDVSQVRTGDPGRTAWVIGAPMLAAFVAIGALVIAFSGMGGS